MKKSKSASDSRYSDQGGHGKHVHTAGPTPYIKIKYDMMIVSGGVEPSFPDLVRRTHTRKDGTFADGRSKMIVEEVETAAIQVSMTESDPDGMSKEGSPSLTPLQLNMLFLEVVPPNKGRIYGLGSAHRYYGDPSESSSTAIPRTLHLETKVKAMEENMKAMEGHMQSMATDIASIMAATRMLLEANGIDPSVVLKSTTSTAAPTRVCTPERQSPASDCSPTSDGSQASDHGGQALDHSPINLANMDPQSIDGYFDP
ncbi:unnamed protein product [Microthlaspi erraticum]|uniref:Uncharacterized protein n=1 Tax=Microthlaspi erraticum TaxID=1685480 RepID=A0A6D2IMJ1_9BRAS|nr:unnamed protein product [Microthlaspi erraticum]